MFTFSKNIMKTILLFNDNIAVFKYREMFYNMYLYHNLWITNLLFQLVNKQTTRHNTTLYSYTGRLWYIFTNDMRLERDGYMTIRNTKSIYETFNLTISSIHLIWSYRQVLVHLITIYTYTHTRAHTHEHTHAHIYIGKYLYHITA